METDNIIFEVNGAEVSVHGHSELEGRKGTLVGDQIAFFPGEGWHNYELYVANISTGKIRKLATTYGELLVDDNDIDYAAIENNFESGIRNARAKAIRYGGISSWDGFKDGLCVISWMLYPDGRYFADSGGFGMEDNDEEKVYAVIDTDLEIVEPFRPISNISAYLKKIRKSKSMSDLLMEVKTMIFNLVIFDESGSMQSIKKAAIDNVNETIQTIRSAQHRYMDQEHYVTLVTFNDQVRTIYDCLPVDEVVEITEETYRPACCTALYDAMGLSLNELRSKVNINDKVLVTVVTDGYENASREYSGPAVKALIDELKAMGWVFAYVGANQDVDAVASAMSITNIMNFDATPEGVAVMGARMSSARERMFDSIATCGFSPEEANKNFFDSDDEIV